MKVVVIVVNNPIFIKFQYRLLEKFMPIPFEFIVFNDAKDFPDYTNFQNPNLREEIRKLCGDLHLKCVDIQNDHHRNNISASSRHAESLRILKDYMSMNPDKYMMLDSDMFPIAPIDMEKYFTYTSAIVEQKRDQKIYMWPNLFYMDTKTVHDWDSICWDLTVGLDTGGQSYVWLMKQQTEHPESIFYIKHLCSCSWDESDLPAMSSVQEKTTLIAFLKNDVRNRDGKFWCEIYDDVFLHYRAGSNWNGEGTDVHGKMTLQLNSYLDSILSTP